MDAPFSIGIFFDDVIFHVRYIKNVIFTSCHAVSIAVAQFVGAFFEKLKDAVIDESEKQKLAVL